MKPLVSILIPAYNSEEWIVDTLRSALAQTWPNKEIIVVDDGSKDRTLDVARRFTSQGVQVITQKNQGAAAARNTAFEHSKGDYIQWLDADDLLSPDKIATQVAKAEESGSKRTLISCGWVQFLYRYYRAKSEPTALWSDLLPAEWLMCKMGQNLHMQTATWLVSRELTVAAGPWNTTLLSDDDGEYFCRVLLASDGVRFTPGERVYYRASGAASLSYIGSSNRKRDAQWHSMKLHIGYLRSLEDTPRTRAACVSYIQNWLVFFYPERLDLVEEMQNTAHELGGEIQTPHLSWKYSWIESLFGKRLGRRAQFVLPRFKWSVLRFGDKMLFRLGVGASSPLRAGVTEATPLGPINS
jgi:glycosyltransferase involved in cell wall biosynthesis